MGSPMTPFDAETDFKHIIIIIKQWWPNPVQNYGRLCSEKFCSIEIVNEKCSIEMLVKRQGGNESIPLRPRLTTAHIPLPPAQLDEAELQVIFGSEDWHSTVPPVSKLL